MGCKTFSLDNYSPKKNTQTIKTKQNIVPVPIAYFRLQRSLSYRYPPGYMWGLAFTHLWKTPA